MKNLIIIGTSTTGKKIYEFVNRYNLYNVIGFAVDKEYKKEETFCNLPVFESENLDPKANYLIFVAIQWNRLNTDRKKIYNKLKQRGFQFANIVSPTAVVNGNLNGENCWISDLVNIDFGVTIGNNVYVKNMAMIGPNTYVKDNSFIGAKSTIGGASIIGEQTFIGLNATIFDNVIIGDKCIVGAGTIIRRNMKNYSKSSVSIEHTLIKQYKEEEILEKLVFSKNVR